MGASSLAGGAGEVFAERPRHEKPQLVLTMRKSDWSVYIPSCSKCLRLVSENASALGASYAFSKSPKT
jgi:hypothetical protein